MRVQRRFSHIHGWKEEESRDELDVRVGVLSDLSSSSVLQLQCYLMIIIDLNGY